MNLGNIVFVRADAGVAIGIGHVRRCAVLAEEIAKAGSRVVLLARRHAGVAPIDLSWPHAIYWLDDSFESRPSSLMEKEERDARETLSAIARHSAAPSWIIMDSGQLGYAWESLVRSAGHHLVVLTDDRKTQHCADILVSDSRAPFASELINAAPTCLQLYGPRYALVDARFSPPTEEPPPSRRRNVLISYGGSDPTHETLKAIEALILVQQALPDKGLIGQINIVVGPLNRQATDIVMASQLVQGAKIHHAPDSLAFLMREADVCVTAGGNSLIEALVMRKRCIVTMTSDNQRAIVRELSQDGAITLLGDHSEVTPVDLASAISLALRGHLSRGNRSESEETFDHHGAWRIVQEMARYNRSAIGDPVGCGKQSTE